MASSIRRTVFSFIHCASFFSLSFFLFTACRQTETEKKEIVYPIKIGESIQRDVPILIKKIGQVYTEKFVQVKAQVGGVLEEVYVKEGQFVKKGTVLYKIDQRPYKAALDSAEADLAKAKAALKISEIILERNKKLVDENYISKLDFEQFQTNVESSKADVDSFAAALEIAKLNLEWTTLVSPIDGRVSQYLVNQGNLILANDSSTFITDIRQISPANILFSLTQTEFIAVQQVMNEGPLKFDAILPQYPNTPYEGTVYFIDNHLHTDSGSLNLKGMIPNEDELFWPGEFIHVHLKLKTKPNAILVPKEAVVIGQEGPYVYIYKPENSTVEYRRVVKGEVVDDFIVIDQGVHIGEKVVVLGQVNLRPHAKVFIAPEAKDTTEL